MKLVVDNEECFGERLSESSNPAIETLYEKYSCPLEGVALKQSELLNHDILVFYMEIGQLKVQLY